MNKVPFKRSQTLKDIIWVCLMAIAVLLICSQFIKIDRLIIYDHLNDQGGYISVARNFLDQGILSSNTIYPSTLWQNTTKNYLYMPGFYLILAASYHLFGFGVFQSLLPNLVSFILASACTFLIGTKIYNRRVGFLSALIFIFFPANMIYACTAMSEMTLIFASTLAFCIFVYLPDRLKPFISPFLLILPFIFRETGALLSIPMALIILFSNKRQNIMAAIGFFLAALVLLSFIFESDISPGLLPMRKANIFDPRPETLYTDAVAQEAISSPTIQDYIVAVSKKVMQNSRSLIGSAFSLRLSSDIYPILPILSIYIILIAMLSAIMYGICKKEIYPLASGALVLTMLLLILSCYYIDYSGLRVLLFTWPLSAIFFASFYERYVLSCASSRYLPKPQLPRFFPITIMIFMSFLSIYLVSNKFRLFEYMLDKNITFLEQIGPDNKKVIVAPSKLYQGYGYKHYPVKWSFIPANKQTLDLLASKFDIGTVVLPVSLYSNPLISDDFEHNNPLVSDDFKEIGLSLVQKVQFQGEEFLIYKKLTK